MKIVLVGNQNAGKSSVFNILTNAQAAVGNRAGVTVGAENAKLKGSIHTLTDLPGTYSLNPFTEEERITAKFVLSGDYDLIINVIDPANLGRSLLLTFELTKLEKPLIVLLNKYDEIGQNSININLLESKLCCPVIAFSSRTKQGYDELLKVFRSPPVAPKKFCYNSPEKACEAAKAISFSVYNRNKSPSITSKIDKIVLNKYLALPIFAVIMFIIYSLSVGTAGRFLSGLITAAVDRLCDVLQTTLTAANASKLIKSLIVNGVLKPLGSVLSFIPQLSILFTLLSVTESTGYLTRAAFIFESLFSRLGLSGKSLIPFIVGTGCSVPAVSAVKTIENKREKSLTAALVPFVPCSAKLPIIALYADFFFGNHSLLFTFSLYVLAIILIIISALIAKLIFRAHDDASFIYEFTDYKSPDIKHTATEVLSRLLSFIKRIGTTVFACSVILWTLNTFTPAFSIATTAEQSILAATGRLFSPLLVPVLGVNSWQCAVCALEGIIAKEQVVASMSVLAGADGASSIFGSAAFDFFDVSSAFSFVVFNLFSPPCVSAIAALKAEVGTKNTVLAVIYQLSVAIFFSTATRLVIKIFI